ncbi:MAG: hypothetical protein R3325_09775 [Thermoanaerobaculia bacterium]|nr:hypothetical protein [Thermoanaerobaculia bacterium]
MRKVTLVVVCCAVVCAAAPALQAQLVCTCDNTGSSICSVQGFEIELVNFEVDQQAGTSFWDYRVCNDADLTGDCVPPKDLSHVNIDLPALGSCLTAAQDISLTQVGGFAQAILACGISEKDPSCDIFGTPGDDFVAKCDIAGGNLDPGECVVMRLSIAGEQPTLGAGAAMTVTKAGPGCAADCILGPSCQPCEPQPSDECLTRTPGFWGTHPHITGLFLPVTVCGQTLTHAGAGDCEGASEALCTRRTRAHRQLVRQLTAAKLNLAASAANGGSCGGAIEGRIAECELLCGAGQSVISSSGCIEDLTDFNERPDTFALTPAPFDSPGPANPEECQRARRSSLNVGEGPCS